MADLSAAEVYDLYLTDATRAAVGSQPLAIDPAFQLSAEFHTNDQISKNTFEHTSDLPGLISANRFEWRAGQYGVFENHAWWGNAGMTEQQYVETNHQNLVNSPTHYAAMTDPNSEIAGVGIEFGPAVDGSGPTYQGVSDYAYVTELFGWNERDPFVTGFVFTDKDGDGKLDMGEGQTGETVTARNVATGQTLTTTTDDGYYGIELDPNSDWIVTIGNEPGTTIHAGTQNVRLDDVDPVVVQPPAQDTFIFTKQAPAPVITNYDPGDILNFSAIDANVKTNGDQAFLWNPTTTHTSKGEIWITHTDFDQDGDLDTAFMANDHSNRQYAVAYIQDDLINPGSLTPGFDLIL
jgi:hypothetical protein